MCSDYLHLLSEKAISDIWSRLVKCCRLYSYAAKQVTQKTSIL